MGLNVASQPHGEGRRPAPLLLLCLIALRPFSFSELALWPLNPTGSRVFSPHGSAN